MKRLLASLLLLSLLLPGQAVAQLPTVRVSPVRSELQAQPGQTVSTPINLQNPYNSPITVQVIPKDFEPSGNLDGEPKILEAGTSPYGISNWLADSNVDRQLTIPANQTISYDAIFRVPANAAERTYYGVVTFRTSDGTDAPAASVASIVFITVGNPEVVLELSELQFGESDDATKRFGVFTAILKNNGQGLAKPEMLLKITDRSGKTIQTIKQDEQGSVLPTSARRFSFTPSTELPKEQLTATLSATDAQGSTDDISMQLNLAPSNKDIVTPADTTSPSSSILLTALGAVVLVLLFTLVTWRLLRKKKANKSAPAGAQPTSTSEESAPKTYPQPPDGKDSSY